MHQNITEALKEVGSWVILEFPLEVSTAGRSQDGRGIGRGDHFLPNKFIQRTIERRANFTKQLLIAS